MPRPSVFRPSLRWKLVLPFAVWGAGQAALLAWALNSPDPAPRWVGLASAVVSPVLAVWLGGRVARRAERLARVADDLAAGQRSAYPLPRTRDELDDAGAALNRYAHAAEARHDALRVQTRLHRQEASRLAAVLAAHGDGLIILDAAGQVLAMNPVARTLLGASQSATDMVALTGILTDRLGEALAPSVYAQGDSLRLGLNGRHVQVQVTPVASHEEARIGTLVMLRDVTVTAQQEQARADLLLSTDALLAALPEQHASGWRAWLKKLRGAESGDDLAVVRETTVFAVEALVWGAANAWGKAASAQHIDLQVDIKARGLRVHGDLKRLLWALGALLDNAIKYTPVGGQVMIQVKDPEDDAVVIRIRDNGVGIAPDELPHVLERFYRGNPRMPDGRPLRVAGVGQGLALAQQVIEAHGGTLSLKSRMGAGTAVYVRLPLSFDDGQRLP
jgi:signal transduction histidine kinase